MKSYRWYNFKEWLKEKTPIYINLNIFKCWKEWRKVKEDFLFPDVKFHFIKGWKNLHFYCFYGKKLFSLECVPLDWKTKFTDYCYERDPYIILQLFYSLFFVWQFKEPTKYVNHDEGNNSHIYYESILQYAYGDYSYKEMKSIPVSLYKVYENNIWRRHGKHNVEFKLTCAPYLTHKGYMKLKKEIGENGKLPGKELLGQRKLFVE